MKKLLLISLVCIILFSLCGCLGNKSIEYEQENPTYASVIIRQVNQTLDSDGKPLPVLYVEYFSGSSDYVVWDKSFNEFPLKAGHSYITSSIRTKENVKYRKLLTYEDVTK